MCLRLPSIVMVNLRLVEHGVICIMLILDIFIVYILPLDICSQVLSSEVIAIDDVRSKDKIVDPHTKR